MSCNKTGWQIAPNDWGAVKPNYPGLGPQPWTT